MGTKSIESENVVRGRRINFLGYCFTKDNVRMRKNMKKNFARKVKRIKSRKQRSKFITNCYNLKDVLDQAREAENNGQKIFPVENVIVKRRSLGDGKSAYYFEE